MKQKRYVAELWNYDNEHYEPVYETNKLQEIDAVIQEAVEGIKHYNFIKETGNRTKRNTSLIKVYDRKFGNYIEKYEDKELFTK